MLYFIFWWVLFIAMTVAYYLAPACIIARKSEHVKFVLVFLNAYALLTLAAAAFGESAIVLWYCGFFTLLFWAYTLWPFRMEKRNQHVRFFLFWAALATLPILLIAAVAAILSISTTIPFLD